MIPVDSSVIPVRGAETNPGLQWHHMAMQYNMEQPPPDHIRATIEPDGDQREGQNDCTKKRNEHPDCDAYTSTAHSTIKPAYSRSALINPAIHDDQPAPVTDNAEKPGELTPEEKEQVRELEKRDREVRQHELNHKALLGPYGGAISYVYQIGPDGKAYAVGGSIDVEVGKESSPAHSLQKANRIRSAAMAAGEPSPADLAVAVRAARMTTESMRQLNGI